MEKKSIFEKLPGVLLPWYAGHKRKLPWRQDREPYHIWVSEIMLQQTRVEAVRGYYSRFLATLPTIESLANADDELLHKLWEGLGYYSRVRNLKKAAQVVMEHHGGLFPREYAQVLALPGIGDYTAGAICSIAYDQKRAAVDGNVLRVISRLMDDDTPIDLPACKKQVQAELECIYPPQAGDFTQALMELGATLCGPNRQPDCERCPCRDFCLGFQRGTAGALPVKLPKKAHRQEDMTVFLLCCDGCYALEKRPETGLLAGLWQFPNVPGKLETELAIEKVEKMELKPKEILRQVEREHVFTHIKWNMRGIYMEVSQMQGPYTWLTSEQIESTVALPTAFRQFFMEIREQENSNFP